jgi:hypothetical protein
MGRSAAGTPFFVIVQSNSFVRLSRRIAVPLVLASRLRVADPVVHPPVLVLGLALVLSTLELGSYPNEAFGETVANLADRSDAIVRALDEVLSRAWS